MELRKILYLKQDSTMWYILSQSKNTLINYYSDIYSYSYSAINTAEVPIELTINLVGKSKNMMYTPSSGHCTKVIQPGEMELIMHAIADPGADSFLKKC